jgi:cell division septation protein DedD
MPTTERTRPTRVGDRVYFVVDSGLVGVSGRDLALVPRVRFPQPVRALAPTPSGDRIFVLTEGSSEIAVVNRYREVIESRIALPGVASELRMDPLGRYLLARAESASTAWVVAVGTARVLGSVETAWRADLPLVLPDGAIALAQEEDVVLVDGETLQPRGTIEGGVEDYWLLVLWNGFRPRAPGLDTAVTFAGTDTAITDYAEPPPPPLPAPQTAPPPPPPDTQRVADAPRPRASGFHVSFAALLSEDRARRLADSIAVDGQRARVVAGTTSGTRVYRVLLGPYASREQAERIGRESGRSYWIFEGNP